MDTCLDLLCKYRRTRTGVRFEQMRGATVRFRQPETLRTQVRLLADISALPDVRQGDFNGFERANQFG